MHTVGSCDITSTIRPPAPHIPFSSIKKRVLGKKYELSIVLIGDTLARRLNREHRGKDYPANVLSFPLSPSEGEIFINVRKAEREAFAFGMSKKARVALLFIHGMYHLAGYQHGSTMEKKETAVLRAFGMSVMK